MIGSARFQNFKALKDVEITFDSPLTVLVGPNGSGKSSVLKGLDLLCDLTGDVAQLDLFPLKERCSRADYWHGGGAGSMVLELYEGGGFSNGIRLCSNPNNHIPAQNGSAKPKYSLDLIDSTNQSHNASNATPVDTDITPSHHSSQLIGLIPSMLAKPSMTKVSPPVFSENGEGLASLMAYFKLYDEPKFEQIEQLFRSIITQVKRIRIDRVKVEGETLGEALLFDLAERKGVPASAMSDGTLYVLGLIVKILDPHRPRVLLIDDIEHGFHPKAQLQIVEMLHKLLKEIPDLQIIATTHSPFILDRLNWNEVRVTGLTDDGAVVIKKIEDHPQIDQWKNEMSPGEFWATFYESWVTQQQPTPLPV